MPFHQARWDEPLLWEIRTPIESKVDPIPGIPEPLLRKTPFRWPEPTELELARHFTRLSQMNFSIETGIYPLGSCTMKYNPRVGEVLARDLSMTAAHPAQPVSTVQGTLEMLYRLEEALGKITGLPNVSLQPAAGAHGEFTGLLVARAYFHKKGDPRTEVILPETAHGTNPASSSMAGFAPREIPSKDGCVDLRALSDAISPRTAVFMLTNPNTAGLFEEEVLEIADRVHTQGALLYYDGANMNAILGKTNPGKMGFDIAHLNLHKTFSTPHGGGGPGAAALCVTDALTGFLPVPRLVKEGRKFRWSYDHPDSIGKVRSFYGNVGMDLRAFAFIMAHGEDGLRRVTERSVLNSNYLAHRLGKLLPRPFKPLVKHEFLLSGLPLRERGLRTLDLAKRLLDEGVHAPTVYFPSLVEESLMVEPPETESKYSLDAYYSAMERSIKDTDENIHAAPRRLAVGRVDEVAAAKNLRLSWRDLRRTP